MLKTILQLFYPTTCPECKIIIGVDEVFCEDCLKKIKPIASRFLQVNSKYSMPVFAVSDYKNPLKSLILKKTFSQSWASFKLAQLILSRLNSLSLLEIDCIIPIPLHWTRYAKRGFNQAEIMANVLGQNLNKPVLNILKRKKRTKYQSSLPVELRAENLKNAFNIISFDELKNKNILLVDDLCTTGATLQNAAKVLVKFNPKSISAVVACRVV